MIPIRWSGAVAGALRALSSLILDDLGGGAGIPRRIVAAAAVERIATLSTLEHVVTVAAAEAVVAGAALMSVSLCPPPVTFSMLRRVSVPCPGRRSPAL